jgi:pyruvate formate lyase activating enzyme
MTSAPANLPPIRGFMPSTLIDWPGRIASIVFLPSCNLRCGYCHAGALLAPEAAEKIPFAEVRSYLEGKKNWIDGVVICGGEPTLHAGLANLCREFHELGFRVKLDTNGTRPEVLAALVDQSFVDAVSMDIKTALDGRMIALARCAVDLSALERSLTLLMAAAVEVEFRTTCSPAFVGVAEIEWIARRIGPQDSCPGGSDYVLQRYEPQHALEPAQREVAPYSGPQMAELLAVARRFNPRTRLRNG